MTVLAFCLLGYGVASLPINEIVRAEWGYPAGLVSMGLGAVATFIGMYLLVHS